MWILVFTRSDVSHFICIWLYPFYAIRTNIAGDASHLHMYILYPYVWPHSPIISPVYLLNVGYIYIYVCNSHLVPMNLPLDSLHTYIYIYIHLFPKYIPIIWSYPCLNSLNTHTPQCRWPNHICFLVETLFRLVKSSFL